jgi:ligand-binding sensor domain-containing protein
MPLFRKALTIILFFNFFGNVFGQSIEKIDVKINHAGGVYNINHYGAEEGLLGSVSEYLFQDSKGYIWIATRSGLNKLDGKHVEVFTPREGLVHYHCRGVTEDSDGLIWVATEKGVSSYDGFDFKNYTVEDGLSYNQVYLGCYRTP